MNEITKLREQLAAKDAVIEKLREALLVSHDLSTSTITRLLNTIVELICPIWYIV